MKLLLHIGTEKTGSSFLQTQLANNRDLLINNKIFYPHGTKYAEQEMRAGRISPGNGKTLFVSLKNQDLISIERLFVNYIGEAKSKDCNTILISNENLIEVFSKEEILKSFLELCKKFELEQMDLLLVLRDPVSQVISLFKHRSKSGQNPDFKEWLSTKYYLPDQLKKILNLKEKFDLNLSVKKYRKDPEYMNNQFFSEWLDIESPKLPVRSDVNPSLTLSELYWLKEVYKKDSFLVPYFYNSLIKIPVKEKYENQNIKNHHNTIANQYLIKYNDIWSLCNNYLSDGKTLKISDINNNESIVISSSLVQSFSQSQIVAINKTYFKLQSYNFKLKLLIVKLKRKASIFLRKK